jgi:hypothetical protein
VQATGKPAPISSFQVLDDLLLRLNDRKTLPALNSIILAGHSGGAQLVQRYAVLTMIDGPIRRGGIDLRYVVANPSSYLYLSDQRPRADGKTYARYERGICPTYNQYKYGPEQLPAYSKDTEESKLFLRYAARNVTYLLGDADNNPEDRQMDKSRGAEAQGSTRLARGLGYVRYEMLRASQDPKPITLRHKGLEVIGVNHEPRHVRLRLWSSGFAGRFGERFERRRALQTHRCKISRSAMQILPPRQHVLQPEWDHCAAARQGEL